MLVRHFWCRSSKIAEISVPAWPMPIHHTKLTIAKLRAEPHHYGLLTELNTRPRTTYLARVANENAELG